MANGKHQSDQALHDNISHALGAHAVEAEQTYKILRQQLIDVNAEVEAGRAAQLESDEIARVSQALDEARERYKAAIKRLGDFAMYNKIPDDLLPDW